MPVASAIVHVCSRCGHAMQVPARYAGREQTCRRCGEPFQVPVAAEEVESPTDASAPRRRALRAVLLVAVVSVALVTAMVLAEWLLEGPPPASELVTRTLAPNVIATRVVEGPLREGTAVLVNDVAAYWVVDGTVYGCNQSAFAWSPHVAPAPGDCDLFTVERAVVGR